MWIKKRPVDLVTRWAQREPFRGHGGGGSRLQWVEEGIRFDKMEIANWRQLLKKTPSAKKGWQKVGWWLEGDFFFRWERIVHVYELC